jgi:hypothetical protein
MAITPELSAIEQQAATCLIQAGMLNRKLSLSESKPADEKDLRQSLFESVQILLQMVTPPEYTLTQGLSTSVSRHPRLPAVHH